MYTLLQDIKKHFESIENKSADENILLSRIEDELQFAPIAFVSRDDIESLGYNAENITDTELLMVANKMGNYYNEYGDYNGDLQCALEKCLKLQRLKDDD
jgi:predicted secreted Zn-dependent protease